MPLNRRTFLGRSAAAGAGVAMAGGAVVGSAGAAEAKGHGHGHGRPAKRYSFTVMGTTDLHGNVFNWDYFTDKEYDDSAHNDVGLAKISTLVDQVRREKGRRNTLLIDAGDTIQGTQLSYYYAKVDPITARRGPVHPMARAMNAIGYDAAALGNHEFNYGIPVLRKFEEQCDFPLLGANALDAKTLRPAFAPYVIKRMRTPYGRDVRVAVLGLTNPGVAIWDKANVGGKMVFPGLEEQAAKWVPKLRSMGADVVLVSAHSGSSGTSSWGDQLPYVENAAALVAEQVPGIDAILVGHAHVEIPEHFVTNKETGKRVVLSEAGEVGSAADAVRFRSGVGEGPLDGGEGRFAGVELQHGAGGPEGDVAAAVGAPQGGGVRQPGHRYVGGGDVDGGRAVEGRADHRSDQPGAGGDGEGCAGGRGVRGVAGVVAGFVLLAYGGDSGR